MNNELENISKKMSGLSAKQKALLALRMKKQHPHEQAGGMKIIPFDRVNQDRFIVSYSQKRFWFLDQWHSNKAANNTNLVSKLVGKLNIAALQQTFNEILKRHEILQMVYENIDDEVYCQRHPQPVLNIRSKIIRTFSKKRKLKAIEDFIIAEIHKPFDLANDLPLRVTLLKASSNEYYLIIVIHHIVSDMWSLRLIKKEIETLYNAFANGAKPAIKELPIQYLDYSAWQRKLLEGEIVEKQIGYWSEILKGAPPCLNLMTDFPRPEVQNYNGDVYKFNIPHSLAEQIQRVSSEESVTPFVLTLTAFAIMLYRYTGMDDIVIGSPVAGRTRRETEDLIGLFINTLALRIDLSNNPSIRELVQKIRQTVIGAVVNQDVPFEKLLEELQVQRNISYSPVFQVMFNYQSIEKSTFKLEGLEISPFLGKNNTTKFDLNLAVKHIEGKLVCFLTYNTDLFLPKTIERFAQNYLQTLSETVNRLEMNINEMSILSLSEQQMILNEWNHSEYKTHPQLPYIHKLFEDQVLKIPQAVAVSSEGKSYTYQELNQKANQLAGYLRTLGIGSEKRVGLFIERSLDMIVGLLGVLKAGGAYVPIDPVYPVDRIKYILDDASIQIVITQEHLKEKLNQLKNIDAFSLDNDWSRVADFSEENLSIQIEPNDLAYIMYTSGSTGKPKGVLTEHRNYMNYYFGAMEKLNLEPGLKYGIVSTFSSDMATITIWAAWSTGGELHVLTYDQSVDPQEYGRYVRDNQIDVIKMVPSHFKALLEQQANLYDLIPERMLIFAGEASYWDMIEEIRSVKPETEIQIHCGPTEVTVSALMYTVPEKRPAQHTTTLPLGRPIANVSIYLLDGNLQPVPIGVPGELCIGGPGIARGYLDRPKLTEEKFIVNPFLEKSGPESGKRLYRSGDMARFLENGDIEFLGRADDQIKIRGYRIELGEVYSTLKEYPAIRDAFADIYTDDNGDKKIVAYFIPEDSQPIALAELRNYMKDQLPSIMVPAVFIQVDKIPITINGKVDRKALPSPILFEGIPENEYEAPRNESEERIANIWAEALNLKKVGINDNFFSLGGDSFKALRVVRSIDPTLSVMDLFKYQTIKELAEIVASERVICDDVLIRISDEKEETEEIAVIGVPFAGGSPITYRPLAQALPDNFALYAVQVPGHEFTRQDEALKPLEEVAENCIAEIKEKICTKSIVVYGHCLGSTLAVEIARRLEQEGFNLIGVFAGGVFPAAYLPGKLSKLWNKLFPRDRNLSNRAYMDLLRSWGGFEEDLSKEEVDFIIRNLRHDRRESERYYTERYADENHWKLKAPLLCIIGELDRTTEFYEEQYKDWEYFSDRVDVRVIPNAGHYFFKHQANSVAEIIQDQLETWRSLKEEENKTKALVGVDGKNEPVMGKPDIVKKPATPNLKSFFILVFGQFVSMMGSNLTNFAMGIWVYKQTGAILDFATTLIFSRLPGILALPFAGALADKKDRRHILIWSNICSAMVTLFIAAFFYQNMLQPWHIYIALMVRSIVTAFRRPAYLAAVAQIVPKRYLGQANGIVQLSSSAGEVFAPLLGGVLVLVLNLSGIILIDFLSYLFPIIILLSIRFPDALFRKSEEPFLTQITGGWDYVRKRHSIVAMIIFFVVTNLILGMANVLITPLVLTFGSTAVLGMIASAAGLGGLTGGIMMSIWGGARNRAAGMIGFNILIGFSYIAMGLQPSAALVMTANFMYGVSLVLVNSHWQTLVQSKVRAELMARVFSINQMFALPTIPLGYYLGGLLSDRIFKPLFVNHPDLAQQLGWLVGTGSERGIGLLFVLLGGLMATCGFLGMKYRPLRYMDDILPNAVPGSFFVKDKDTIQKAEDRELEGIKIRMRNIQKKVKYSGSAFGR